METVIALQETGCAWNFASGDVIRLVSSTMDYVKFKRRRDLVGAVRHLPLTVITDQDFKAEFPGTALRFRPSTSFSDLLRTMADAKSVVCPLPHFTGFHERAMGALSAGAYVVAAPNEVLETNFAQERELLIYRNTRELTRALELILSEGERFEEPALAGRQKAMMRFGPDKLVSSILSALSLQAVNT
ncbi:hypothetical protein Q9L58_010731 [Maublancomyces gigas]|uniref:Spore protein YkvP/CgeB glycosyl transferase-like domain-containing protein n=1 Tax=Discina gigas TaxID=1032678 RepID=A0ABR3G396_9PEZI